MSDQVFLQGYLHSDRATPARIRATSAGELLFSRYPGKVTFTIGGNGLPSAIAIEKNVDGTVQTWTRTLTYDGSNRLTEISAPVIT